MARAPWWVRLRGMGGDEPWDKGIRFRSSDPKGFEVCMATNQGAVVVRVRPADIFGKIMAQVYLIPWVREDKSGSEGTNELLYSGPIGWWDEETEGTKRESAAPCSCQERDLQEAGA